MRSKISYMISICISFTLFYMAKYFLYSKFDIYMNETIDFVIILLVVIPLSILINKVIQKSLNQV